MGLLEFPVYQNRRDGSCLQCSSLPAQVVRAVRQTSLREMTERQYGSKSAGSNNMPRKVQGKYSSR